MKNNDSVFLPKKEKNALNILTSIVEKVSSHYSVGLLLIIFPIYDHLKGTLRENLSVI